MCVSVSVSRACMRACVRPLRFSVTKCSCAKRCHVFSLIAFCHSRGQCLHAFMSSPCGANNTPLFFKKQDKLRNIDIKSVIKFSMGVIAFTGHFSRLEAVDHTKNSPAD